MSRFSKSVTSYPWSEQFESLRGGIRVDVHGDGQEVSLCKIINGVEVEIASGTATCIPPLTLEEAVGASSQYIVKVDGTNGTCAQIDIIDTNYSITNAPEIQLGDINLGDVVVDTVTIDNPVDNPVNVGITNPTTITTPIVEALEDIDFTAPDSPIYIGEQCFEMAGSVVTQNFDNGTMPNQSTVSVPNFDDAGTDASFYLYNYYGSVGASANGVTVAPTQPYYATINFSQPVTLDRLNISDTGGQGTNITSVNPAPVDAGGDWMVSGSGATVTAGGSGFIDFGGVEVTRVTMNLTGGAGHELTLESLSSVAGFAEGRAICLRSPDGTIRRFDKAGGGELTDPNLEFKDCGPEQLPEVVNVKCFEIPATIVDTTGTAEVFPAQTALSDIVVTPSRGGLLRTVKIYIDNAVQPPQAENPFSIEIMGQVIPAGRNNADIESTPGNIPSARFLVCFDLPEPIRVETGVPIRISAVTGGVAGFSWTSSDDNSGGEVAYDPPAANYPQVSLILDEVDTFQEREFSDGSVRVYDGISNQISSMPNNVEQVSCQTPIAFQEIKQTCLIDDVNGDQSDLVKYVDACLIQVSGNDVTSNNLGSFTDSTLKTRYNPVNPVDPESLGTTARVRQGRVEISGATWSPNDLIRSYSVVSRVVTNPVSPPTFTDSFGNVTNLPISVEVGYSHDLDLLDSAPVVTVPADDKVIITYTQIG